MRARLQQAGQPMTRYAKAVYSNMPRRYFRIGVAFLCIAVAAIAFVLHVTNMVTADAVLDGRRVVIRSQIDGRVLDGAPRVGDVVGRNDLVAAVVAQVTDRRSLLSAQAERDEVAAKLAALDGERGRLEALRTQLQAEVSRFVSVSLARVDAELKAAQSNAESADATYRVAHADAERARKMVGTGSMGASEIDQKIGAEEEAKHKLAATRAELARLMVEAGAFAAGINARDGQNDVPYSRQRLDEISIRLNEIGSERAALVARDSGLAQEVARESEWLSAQTRFESRALEQAVVWRQPVAAGTDVARGDVLAELVDCADMFVLARVPLDDAATISPGDAVSIEIAGTRSYTPGEVRIVRGSTFAPPRGAEASGLDAPGVDRWAEVEIKVDPRNIRANGGNLCGIGTGARVWFEGRSIISPLLAAL
jgi:multidrug efflux pump subunit AcrA (membrane-fusion protein)